MTKKEIIEALAPLSDSDEVIVNIHASEILLRNIFNVKVMQRTRESYWGVLEVYKSYKKDRDVRYE